MKNICVFASSSAKLKEIYKTEAKNLGRSIAKKGIGIVFGAGTEGLMGELARGAEEHDGTIIGVIPDSLNVKGIVFEHCTKLYDTRTMHERKAIMERESDAFIALPGGFGTFEEILEIITLKQLGYHNKPIVILNTNGYYHHLIAQFEETVNQDFAVRGALDLFVVSDNIDDTLSYIYKYTPGEMHKKNMLLK